MKIALVVPHIFMHREILPQVIFSPAALAIQLAEGAQRLGAEVTLFSPGPVDTSVRGSTADLSLFEQELRGRGYGYIELLKKHPATFIALARQVQSELVADAFARANAGEFDLVHIYTNEEDIALPFAQLCTKPVVFTHHDPFNFLIKYKNNFPKYKHLPWISMSLAQRGGMPPDTNWLANIYHGLDGEAFTPEYQPAGDYVVYLGRIIEPKGVHLAIQAVQHYNRTAAKPLTLKIAGKHYAGHKDTYWSERIQPEVDGAVVQYLGFVGNDKAKHTLLAGARAVLVPSLFEEPFGMVLIEALACATPVIGLDSGAIPEVIEDGKTGYIVPKQADDRKTAAALADVLGRIDDIRREQCRAAFEQRFTIERMCREHIAAYKHALHQEQ
jgi:glycosyltransferase involved in cell wall biosynthesis